MDEEKSTFLGVLYRILKGLFGEIKMDKYKSIIQYNTLVLSSTTGCLSYLRFFIYSTF
jgi:hypothetical protein